MGKRKAAASGPWQLLQLQLSNAATANSTANGCGSRRLQLATWHQHYVCHDAHAPHCSQKARKSNRISPTLLSTANYLTIFPVFALSCNWRTVVACCCILAAATTAAATRCGSEKLVMTIKWPTLHGIRGVSSIAICRGWGSWLVFLHTHILVRVHVCILLALCVATDAFRLLQLPLRRI